MGFYDKHKHPRPDDHQGVDDWLMTYADMITLLLCFFAVFLSVSVPEKEQFQQARQKVLEQFADPDILKDKFPPLLDENKVFDEEAPYENLPSIVDRFRKEGVTIVQGDKLTTIDVNSRFFFPSGAAALSEEGTEFLKGLVPSLRTGQFKDYLITVEGHTDDNPINTPQFPSNWELSTGRAASVVRYFLTQGVPAERLRAAGYADVFPKVANRTPSGVALPNNQAQNRRVVIKLEKIEKDKAE